MTGAYDEELRDEVEALIDEVGAPATYKVVTRTPDIAQSTVVASSVPHAVVVTPPMPFSSKLVNNSTVLATDLSVLMAAQAIAFIPKLTDKLSLPNDAGSAVEYDVTYVDPIQSGARVCAYTLGLRKIGALP